MQQLSRSWKGLMAAGLLAWTAACGGGSQDTNQSPDSKGSEAVASPSSVPGQPPAGTDMAAARKQAFAAATANPLAPVVTESGFISLSLDGVGTNGASGVVQV